MSWIQQQPISKEPKTSYLWFQGCRSKGREKEHLIARTGKKKPRENIVIHLVRDNDGCVAEFHLFWAAEAVWILHSLKVNTSGVQPGSSSSLDQCGWSPGSHAPPWCGRASAPPAGLWEAETSTTLGCWVPPRSLASCSRHRCVPWCFEGWRKKRRSYI